jgi:hypothetical protein
MRAHDRQLAAFAAAPEEATGLLNQIIDAVMARSIQPDAVRTHPPAAAPARDRWRAGEVWLHITAEL